MQMRLLNWLAWGIMLPALGIAAFATSSLFRSRESQPISLRISAGSAEGARHQIAERLRAAASEHGLELEVVPCDGSEDALDQVNDGRLDLALVQGGLSFGDRHAVRQAATLHLEPLHLLVREYEGRSPVFGSLKGKRINTSKGNSGTSTLSLELLDFVGLERSEVLLMEFGYGDLLNLPPGELPEAVFMVSTVPSPVAKRLVSDHNYELAEIPFASSILKNKFAQYSSQFLWTCTRTHLRISDPCFFLLRRPSYSTESCHDDCNTFTLGCTRTGLGGGN